MKLQFHLNGLNIFPRKVKLCNWTDLNSLKMWVFGAGSALYEHQTLYELFIKF